MKLLSAAATLLVFLAPISTTARSLDIFRSSQSPIQVQAQSVGGDNPLEYCTDPSDNILDIQSVNLSPNPPLPGKTLVIEAKGTFHERIEQGAYVLLEVKYGLITLIRQTADLCEQIVNVDLKCPLEKGEMTLTKQVDLPKQIPPGKYTVHADVYTNDDRRITCLDARNIEFKGPF
ncbi:Phosphatidylglycerol/phosphatidylinositol transfer protein [Aspergillus alliaceus]|uniref:Phosphatidylglycerol/phosphatidylinositol transfer protein n=1 Tax=Petromyces alliaceus TaxID=209559 RepID=A0A5N7C154_PETAA|nr:Phosphatidylglycerol/phosphatidylinositol transfer protein [Aspergillus alliaceus]KAB8235325.1 Phosphatidylglycerol/phosphatidylinositol transfer protein [Aspergillus alliaceus]KAE8387573.1 Phosphatidylglycerol/phosphatidylinositol transfer protein [Aspergillus alliaceus]KAF5863167.1 Phosphatidylglycerol/phosphatidylinositol transfer protein [Aspergillus burnettii]